MSTRIALGGPRSEAAERLVLLLVERRIASRITAQDATVLPEGTTASLAWTEAVADAVPLVDQVSDRRHTLRHEHLRRAVVPRPTGATLAAAMIARTIGLEVDSNVADLDHAVLVAVNGAEAPADVPRERLVRVDSALTGADGALSPASLVPAGLAGADLAELLDEAQSELANLAADVPENPGLLLGAAIATADGGVEIDADGTHIVGLPVWAARLLAEADGADRVDIAGPPTDPTASGPLRVRLVEDAHAGEPGDEVLLSGTLGELIMVWQYAAVVALIASAIRA